MILNGIQQHGYALVLLLLLRFWNNSFIIHNTVKTGLSPYILIFAYPTSTNRWLIWRAEVCCSVQYKTFVLNTYVVFGRIISALTWYAVWAFLAKLRLDVENTKCNTQAKFCCSMLNRVVLCWIALFYVELCCSMLNCVVLCLNCVVLCRIVLFYVWILLFCFEFCCSMFELCCSMSNCVVLSLNCIVLCLNCVVLCRIVLFYVELCSSMHCLCRLCCSLHCLCVNVYCATATGWLI
jgi:hypothetical protein